MSYNNVFVVIHIGMADFIAYLASQPYDANITLHIAELDGCAFR
jgi:hypothetical protein